MWAILWNKHVPMSWFLLPKILVGVIWEVFIEQAQVYFHGVCLSLNWILVRVIGEVCGGNSFLCMTLPLPLAASTNSELNLKAIFLGVFQVVPNNQEMASAFPCVDYFSMGTWWVDLPTHLAFTSMSGVAPLIAWCKTDSGFVYVFINLFHSSMDNNTNKSNKGDAE